MAYSITLTNGTVLTSVANNTIDTTTSLTLIGRNYSGYGGYIAENFIHALENFSNTSPPGAPLTGQLWYDSTLGKLQVWNGTAWVDTGAISDGITISGTTSQNVGLILSDPSAPSGSRFYRWRVRDDAPYAGDLVCESLDDDGATVNTVCLTMDHAGDTAFAGNVTAPNIRIKMTGALNLYVSTTGSDSNSGLNSGTPFLTLQRATYVAEEYYDTQGYTVVINVANGTYTTGVTCLGTVGNGAIEYLGNPTTPADVIVALTAPGNCFNADYSANILVNGFTLGAPFGSSSIGQTPGDCLAASIGGVISFENIIFGATQRGHMETGMGGLILAAGNYMISGGAEYHMIAGLGEVVVSLVTVTLTGTPAFSGAFAWAEFGYIYVVGTTYTGAATGSRYLIGGSGLINTNGGGASFLPGNSPGTGGTSTGGGYYA